MPTNSLRRLALSLSFFGVALMPLACSGERAHPVRGEVFVNGKPAAGAVVHLHPRDKNKGKPAFATVGPDGAFQASTFGNNDGAIAGDYGVTISWFDERVSDGEKITSPDKLRERFSKAESSGLSATVKAGKNDLPRFELKAN